MRALAKRPARRIPVAALPDERDAPEPYLDWGPAPPERYGEDALGLLVQGPRSVELRGGEGRLVQRIAVKTGETMRVHGALKPAFALLPAGSGLQAGDRRVE